MLQRDVPKRCRVLPWPLPLTNLQDEFCVAPKFRCRHLEMHYAPWAEMMNLDTRTAVEHSFSSLHRGATRPEGILLLSPFPIGLSNSGTKRRNRCGTPTEFHRLTSALPHTAFSRTALLVGQPSPPRPAAFPLAHRASGTSPVSCWGFSRQPWVQDPAVVSASRPRWNQTWSAFFRSRAGGSRARRTRVVLVEKSN